MPLRQLRAGAAAYLAARLRVTRRGGDLAAAFLRAGGLAVAAFFGTAFLAELDFLVFFLGVGILLPIN